MHESDDLDGIKRIRGGVSRFCIRRRFIRASLQWLIMA